MSRWSGEMEFDFVEAPEGDGAFVATTKGIQFLRGLLARGDVAGAARLYEDIGTGIAAELVEEAKSASSATQKAMAEMFAQARDFASAAKIFEIGRRFQEAARMHAQAGDAAGAARCLEKIGDAAGAAAAWERAGRADLAADLYEKAGHHESVVRCLARQGRFMEAAAKCRDRSDMRGEVEMLRHVPVEDAARPAAIARLAELLEQHGRVPQAIQIMVELVRTVEAARNDADLHLRLLRLFDAAGQAEQAARLRAFVAQRFKITAPAPAPQGVYVAPALPLPRAPARQLPAHGTVPSSAAAFAAAAAATAAAAVPTAVPTAEIVEDDAEDPVEGVLEEVEEADPFAAQESNEAYSFLKSIPIFAELSLADMKELYRLSDRVGYPPGAVIIEQGNPGTGLVVLVMGNVEVLRVNADATTTHLAQLGAGSYVGELSLVDDAPASARVVARGAVGALFIPRDVFGRFLASHEGAALGIYRIFTRTLADRLRQANKR